MEKGKYRLPAIVFVLVFILLGFVQIKLDRPIIMAERFLEGAGWIEIILIALYGAFVARKMEDKCNVPKWRRITWSVFSAVFFGQLIIGLAGAEKFLMTGKLHLPVPMMILGGPVYRGEISVMTILFISTVMLTGPAWCSHYCYFGALDSLASEGRTPREKLKNKSSIKSTILILVIITAILLRLLNVEILAATLAAIAFGIGGIIIMLVLSSRTKKMVHCIYYCPVGTLVNILRPVNPFRMYIDRSCTLCNHCTSYCKYDALNIEDIKKGRPGLTCTYCGDCLAGCSHDSIRYRFLKMKPVAARKLYLAMTITIHASCIALARI